MNVKNKLLTAFSSLRNHDAIIKAVMADRSIISEISCAIARSTDRRDKPIEDKYVHEILFVVSNNPGSITYLTRRISRQMEASKNWMVSMKTLVLVHRLLRSGDRYFDQDLHNLWFSRELRLSPSRFWLEKGQPHSFLINYSLFLEQRMSWMINQAGNLEPMKPKQPELQSHKGDSAEKLLHWLTKCLLFLDRVVGCLQGNMSSQSLVVQSATNMILRESFQVYDRFNESMDTMLSTCCKLEKPMKALALDIIEKASIQMPRLHDFYDNCKRSMVGKSFNYPFVRIIRSTDVSSIEDSSSHRTKTSPILSKDKNSSEKTKRDQNEEQCYVMQQEDSTVPFSGKFETTISTVWVEFDEDDSPTLSACLIADSSSTLLG